MHKLRSLVGLPVLETEKGTQIGEVQEVVLDIERASVRCIIIVSANWFTANQGILFEDIFRIGRDAVTVRDSTVVQEVSALLAAANIYKFNMLADKQIYTESGLSLGTLVDICYDCTTGEIKAYEVSDGVITDLLNGRMTMPLPQAQIVSEDKLIVPESMAKLLHAQADYA